MQNKIRRYSVVTSYNERADMVETNVVEEPQGAYVAWRDYNTLKSALESANAENAKLRATLNWIVFHSIDTASISKAKGAELLEISLIDMDNYRNSLDIR